MSVLITTLLLNLPFALAEVKTCPFTAEQSFAYFQARFGKKTPAVSADELAGKTFLQFAELGFTDQDVPALCPLIRLKGLSIYNDPPVADHLTGLNLEFLSALPDLEYLDLESNEIRASELYRLKGARSLKTLRLGMGNPLGNDGMTVFDEMPELSHLILQGNDLDAGRLVWLSKSKKVWEILDLSENPRLGNSALPILSHAKVNALYLDRSGIRSAKNFDLLAANPYLHTLSTEALPEDLSVEILHKLSASKWLRALDMKLPLTPKILNVLKEFPALEDASFSMDPSMPDQQFIERVGGFLQAGKIKILLITTEPRMVYSPHGLDFCMRLNQAFPQVHFALTNKLGARLNCQDANSQSLTLDRQMLSDR